MTEIQSPSRQISSAGAARGAAKTVLATTGLLGAFGVAACCALPIALAAIGLGSSALLGVAQVVGPYQHAVLVGAVVCLATAGGLLWRQRRAHDCGAACRRPVLDHVSMLTIGFAVLLLALTFWLELPR